MDGVLTGKQLELESDRYLSFYWPFIILGYINDIVHVVNHCNLRFFADDTCLYIEVEDR